MAGEILSPYGDLELMIEPFGSALVVDGGIITSTEEIVKPVDFQVMGRPDANAVQVPGAILRSIFNE